MEGNRAQRGAWRLSVLPRACPSSAPCTQQSLQDSGHVRNRCSYPEAYLEEVVGLSGMQMVMEHHTQGKVKQNQGDLGREPALLSPWFSPALVGNTFLAPEQSRSQTNGDAAVWTSLAPASCPDVAGTPEGRPVNVSVLEGTRGGLELLPGPPPFFVFLTPRLQLRYPGP